MVWPDPSGDSASGGDGDGEDSAVRRLREENETLQARLGALVSAQLRAAEAGTGTESQLTELRDEVAALKGALAQAEAEAQRQVSRTIVARDPSALRSSSRVVRSGGRACQRRAGRCRQPWCSLRVGEECAGAERCGAGGACLLDQRRGPIHRRCRRPARRAQRGLCESRPPPRLPARPLRSVSSRQLLRPSGRIASMHLTGAPWYRWRGSFACRAVLSRALSWSRSCRQAASSV